MSHNVNHSKRTLHRPTNPKVVRKNAIMVRFSEKYNTACEDSFNEKGNIKPESKALLEKYEREAKAIGIKVATYHLKPVFTWLDGNTRYSTR